MNLPPASLEKAKTKLRMELKKTRAGLTAAARAKASSRITASLLALPETVSARSLFIYISRDPEVDTHTLIRHFLDQNLIVAVPRILPDKSMIAVRFTSWAELVPGELGILTPKGSEPCPGHFDLIITPGIGFSLQGHRLGYGRGYYDRWFAKHTSGKKIGLAFETQISATIPFNDRDIPVDKVITENRIIIP